MSKRQCVLFFHGSDGKTAPRPMGGLRADTLSEALEIMEQPPAMPAARELAGVWCCSFADVGDEGPEHPATCQYTYRLSAMGRISEATILQ